MRPRLVGGNLGGLNVEPSAPAQERMLAIMMQRDEKLQRIEHPEVWRLEYEL